MSVLPPNRIRVTIEFESEGVPSNATFASLDGMQVLVTGPLWPNQLRIVNDVLAVVYERKDQYPAAKK